MAEKDFRNSNRHHGRRNKHVASDAHSDDVNAHVSEPARRVGKRNQHKKEENPHKERATKMSKRATRVISRVAASIAFIFILTANTFGFERRDPRPADNRANARPEVFSTAFDFDKSGADFNRQESRIRYRAVRNFERFRGDVSAFRIENRNGSRALETLNLRVREREFNNRPDNRSDFTSRPIDIERPDERFDGRRNDERNEFGFRADRGLRLGYDFDFSRNVEARTDRDNA